jgi:Tol biopolymer transport system component
MTRNERFERSVPDLIEELYPIATPHYRDDLIRAVAATRQRPAWTFIERWLPMDIATTRVPGPYLPWRAIGVLVSVALLIAALIVAAVVGSRPRLPDPIGPARNGNLTYGSEGDIYVRNAIHAAPQVLIGEAFEDTSPWFTADGTRILFLRTIDGQQHLMTARADGTGVTQLVAEPLREPWWATSADGASLALVNRQPQGPPRLLVMPVDGSAEPSLIDLGRIRALNVTFRNPGHDELLVRGLETNGEVEIFRVKTDGSSIEPLGLESRLAFGPEWDLTGVASSPDGSRIAYNVVEPDGGETRFRVHVINADGSDDRELPGPDDFSTMEAWPTWSPDGSQLLVHRWTWGTTGQGWLAVMPADGSAQARDIGPRIPGGEQSGLAQLWSPDGTRVLMRASNTRQVFSIDPVSGDYQELPWNSDAIPEWQRLAP